MSRKCIVNFISFCIFPAAKGQISGKVFDNKTDVPIEYANILLKRQQILEGTISKIDGSFLLPDVDNGKFSLKISFLGYETLETQNFNIQKNTPLDLGVIYLQNSQNLLDEVVVDAKRIAIINKIDRQVYSNNEFSTAKGGTGIDVIRNLPSFSINGVGEISLRGSTGFVVLLNNKPIQSDIQNLLDQIPANSIKNIEVITAPSAQYDSEGKAGIINILTLKTLHKATISGQYAYRYPSVEIEKTQNLQNVLVQI